MINRPRETFVFECEQWFPLPLERVFAFFADAVNLQEITPPWLHFKVLTPSPIAMKVGTLIDYKLRIHALPVRWRTLISQWQPPHRFVDEQIRGPYKLWRHLHTFEPVDGGTLVKDHVDYQSVGGSLVNRFFIRPDLEKIFGYRQMVLTQKLGNATGGGDAMTHNMTHNSPASVPS